MENSALLGQKGIVRSLLAEPLEQKHCHLLQINIQGCVCNIFIYNIFYILYIYYKYYYILYNIIFI
uniref:Uncharacterized protein n=1 Tax=Candidatus Shikimatogenerans sp. Tder TaxID=3158566 RepID=A0AAU7QRZ3_9FLAO